MAGIETINPLAIKAGSKPKAMSTGKDFNAFLGAVEAFAPAGATAGQMYGDVNSSTVLGAAFSGVSTLNAQTAGGGVPSFAHGTGASYAGGGFGGGFAGTPAFSKGVAGGGQAVVAGTNGFNRADLVNSLHSNSLELLELQATMQTHLQQSNIKSNILSADHRARMSMIEKFTARG